LVTAYFSLFVLEIDLESMSSFLTLHKQHPAGAGCYVFLEVHVVQHWHIDSLYFICYSLGMRDLDPTKTTTKTLDLTLPPSEEEFRENFTQLLDTDLKPYVAHNNILLRRLKNPNRLVRQAPELITQMSETFQADDDQSLYDLAEDIDIARQLYEPENTKPINRLLSYLTLMETTSSFSEEAHIRERRNAVDALVAQKVADSFDEDQLDRALQSAAFLEMKLDELASQTPNNQFSILRAKMHVLRGEIKSRHSAYKYIDMLPEDTDTDIATPEKVEKDSKVTAGLFETIRSTQAFGVKMGYISERTGGTLVFSPPFDAASLDLPNVHPIRKDDFSVVEIIHSRKQKHQRLKLGFDQTVEGVAEVSTTDLDPIINISIGKDGELYGDSYGKISIRDIAVRKGRYAAYRELQAHLYAHYYDLTHRLEDVYQAQKETGEKTDPAEPFSQTTDPFETMTRLVIPRVQLTKGELASATEAEVTEDAYSKVKRHGVTWHRRVLPEGWHASPKALELAAKLGVTLKDNETLVKEHERGSRLLGEVTAHHLVKSLHQDSR
jgi:hypothetical protein